MPRRRANKRSKTDKNAPETITDSEEEKEEQEEQVQEKDETEEENAADEQVI